MVVHELAARAGERFRKARFVPADVCELKQDGERILLGMAHAFMNENGPAFASLARKHRIAEDHVIAVHDEIDLPFCALRIKFGGSAAGHNGVRSLAAALRTQDFFRVRLGVGRPAGRKDPVDWVLEDFGKREEADVALLVDDGADAVLTLVRDGLQVAQDRFNRSGPCA
jgi:PTH1 family peptidyl-tRNA hydrolase